MESSRFFVANLPASTTESDMKLLFQDYGQIENIELKRKINLVDPDDVKIIAFVTLNIGTDDAQYYLNDLNRHKVQGQKVKVSLAKESFLERLKREREEAKAFGDGTLPGTPQHELQSYLLKAPRENKRKTFDVNAELGDDEVAAELMISKKCAASSIHNGKIVIQSHDVQPIHVIEKKHKKNKQKDTKSSNADQKRKESLNKMKNQYQQNKTAIQQALQKGLDGNLSKKIKFSDGESDQEYQKAQESAKKSKMDIFGSDDDSGRETVGFNYVPLGKKGEKLVQLQAKQSLDPRFRIDAKFVDDNDEDDNYETADKNEHLKTNDGNDQIDLDHERQWQMNILEQVVGTKLDKLKSAEKSQRNKMLRYDPSIDEHQKFERSKEDNQIKRKHGKSKATAVDDSAKSNSVASVSKEVFYVVTDTLQESLRTRGEGFSLLNMFGKAEQLEQRDEQLKQLGSEKILVNNKLEKSFTINPFSYDSSSESECGDIITEKEDINAKESDNTNTHNPKKTNKKLKITKESFFIPKNDIRLKEGAKFFIYNKKEDATNENYEEVRNRLKLLIKTKITKTKKNLTNAGYKGKRKF